SGFGVSGFYTGGQICVPEEYDIVLNLNGHTLFRDYNIPCMQVYGKLTLVGSGTIKGGANGIIVVGTAGTFIMNGGTLSDSGNSGVSVSGSFTMNGGTICNNGGAGVAINSTGVANLNGGTITGNNRGVSVGNGLYIKGSIQITDNTVANVYLVSGKVINISGKLTSARVGVTMADGTGVFTKNYSSGSVNSSSNYSAFFFADNGNSITYKSLELQITEDTAPAKTVITWQYRLAGSSDWTTVSGNVTLNYTGSTYNVRGLTSSNSTVYITSSSYTAIGSNTSTAIANIKNTGSYSYVASGTSYSNPTFTLTINPVNVTVVWDSEVLKYSGKVQYPTATLSGVVEGDTVSLVYDTSDVGKNANTEYTVKVTGIKGTSSFNYNLIPSTKIYQIDKAQLIKPQVGGSLTYNGTEQTYSIGGYDSATMTLTGVNKAKNAGDYEAILSITDTQNYEWADGKTDPLTLKWTIEKLYVTPVGGITVENKYYDGTNKATVSSTGTITLQGVLDDDADKLNVGSDPFDPTSAVFDGVNVGGHTVTINGLVLTGDAAKNYRLTSTKAVGWAIILPAELKISGYGVQTKVYDSTRSVTFTKTVDFQIEAVKGDINLDDAANEYLALVNSVVIKGNFVSANVGTGIGVENITFSHDNSAIWNNYVILTAESIDTTLSGDITARKAVVEINDIKVAYGNEANLVYKYSSTDVAGNAVDGVLPQDDLKIQLVREQGTAVNEYKISFTSNNPAIADNYEIIYVRVLEDGTKTTCDVADTTTYPVYKIVKAKATVVVNGKNLYYGEELVLTASDVIILGLLNGDTLGGTVTLDTDASHYNGVTLYNWDGANNVYPEIYATDGTKINYGVLATGYTSDNYEIEYIAGNLNLLPKRITVEINAVDTTYGHTAQTAPAMTWKLASGSALLGGQTLTDLGVTLTREEGAEVNGYEEAGRYLISGTSSNKNYEVNFRENYYVIGAYEITIVWCKTANDTTDTATPFVYEYTGNKISPVASFTGVADPATGIPVRFHSEQANSAITVNGSGVNAGKYVAQVILKDTKNYKFSTSDSNVLEVEFEITPKKLEVKWYKNKGDAEAIILGTNLDGKKAEYTYDLNKIFVPYATADFFEADVNAGVKLFVEGGKTSVGNMYTATAHIVGSANYVLDANTVKCLFNIVMNTYSDIKWIVWENGEEVEYVSGNLNFNFNGEAQNPVIKAEYGNFTYEITNLKTNAKVQYAINAGQYKIVATPVSANTKLNSADATFVFEIKPLSVDVKWKHPVTGETFTGDVELEFNGKVQKPVAYYVDFYGQEIYLNVTLGGNGADYGKNAGEYSAQTKLPASVINYVLNETDETPDGVVEATFKITPKAIRVTWTLNDDGEFVYNGLSHDGQVTVTPDLENPVEGSDDDGLELPALVYSIVKDGKTVSEIKDADNYVLKVALQTKNANYTIVDAEQPVIVNKAPLKITTANQTVTTGNAPAQYSVAFDGFVNGEDPVSLGVATGAVANDDPDAIVYYEVSWLYSDYEKNLNVYTQEGYKIVITNIESSKQILALLSNYDWEDDFVPGLITLKVTKGHIRVSLDEEYDGNAHTIKAYYFNGNDDDDQSYTSPYWIPVDVQLYTDNTYTTVMTEDADGNALTDENGLNPSVTAVGKYYIKLLGLPEWIENAEAQSKKVYEIKVRTVVVKIYDLHKVYGDLTRDNYKDLLAEHIGWDWSENVLQQPATGDDLGITLDLYIGARKVILNGLNSDLDTAGYFTVLNGGYTIKGEWNVADFGDSYKVIFEGVGSLPEGVQRPVEDSNVWGLCIISKATVNFKEKAEDEKYDQMVENTGAVYVNQPTIGKHVNGSYVNFTYAGNQSAEVKIYYKMYELNGQVNVPVPEDDLKTAEDRFTIIPTFDSSDDEDKTYAVNFRISIPNHEDYYGQWIVFVLGDTVCVKIVFSDKPFNTVYGGLLEDGTQLPEGKELTKLLIEGGFIDLNRTTLTGEQLSKLSAKIVAQGSVNSLTVGKYDLIMEGVENIIDGNFVITYKNSLADDDSMSTNVGKFIINRRQLNVEWGNTQFTYNGEKQLPKPVIEGWSCAQDYTADGVYTFVNDVTGESIKVKVTLSGDFVTVGGHKYTVEIVDNDNYSLDPVNATCAVSITGEMPVVDPGVQTESGIPLWLIIVVAVALVVAVVALVVVLTKRRTANTDTDGFYDPAE
ncbi:MAG: hypothetical protein HDQ88_10570, partial [Clostridia bacterium]|nr:hypothetical protein [Clostridia bacterium]